MEFEDFAEWAAKIEDASADSTVVSLLVELLHVADDLPIVVRFVQGRIVPGWDSTTLDIGPSLCYTAIARAAGPNVDVSDVETRLAELGEIGAVAEKFEFGDQRGLSSFGNEQPSLSIVEVHETLRELAETTGPGSEDRKVTLLFRLFNQSSALEARYLARLVLGEMRIGVGEGMVRDAIAEAFDLPVETVERALQVSNDYGEVASTAREEGLDGLDAFRLEVGRPIQSMLAQSGTVTDALDSWEAAGVEIKYDGARIQAHYDGTAAKLFSRNMQDVTEPLPEVVEFVEANVDVPAILDGEVVAVADGEIQPFQEVLRRFRREHEIERMRETVTVEAYFFDCLHADGDDLLDEPLVDRHEWLDTVLEDGVSSLWLETTPTAIEDIEVQALEAGHEGIMLKNPNSTYTPGRRGKHWLKRKPDVETLDCVVTGAEWGEGRRATFFGTFELSVRDDGTYHQIGKVATGITDEELEELTELLEPHVVAEEGTEVDIEPSIVFEVGYEEIQRSPNYTSGYALRFPRFVTVREDLSPRDADTLDRVARLAD